MKIWGLKTVALFDVWSFEHLIGGITVGAIIIFFLKQNPKNKILKPIIFLFLAYFWEFIEYNLELGVSHINVVTYWFQGVEFWGNRLITDPMLGLIGYFIALNYKRYINFAKIISISWYIVHIFIFPHCMYLQLIFT
jgi:hypothetical protein